MTEASAAQFHRVLAGVCPTCSFVNFCGCNEHHQLLSVARPNGAYGCGARNCKASTLSQTFRCGRCDVQDLAFRPLLILADEVNYLYNSYYKTPKAQQQKSFSHGALVCALCQSASFPGMLDALVEHVGRDDQQRTRDNKLKPMSDWTNVHIHVAGCDGVGNEFVLEVVKLLLTHDEVNYIRANLANTLRGVWNDPDDAPPMEAASPKASQKSPGQKKSTVAKPAKSSTLCVGECAICLEVNELFVFYKCGHMVSCESCAHTLKKKPCPICRVTIDDSIRVYRL